MKYSAAFTQKKRFKKLQFDTLQEIYMIFFKINF